MGVNISSEERDQFAVDLYNETFRAIQNQDRIGIKAIMVHLRAQVVNSNYFDDYALSCKLDLVLNNLVRAKKVEFASGFEGENILIGFSELKMNR
jgi:hypothetical protein